MQRLIRLPEVMQLTGLCRSEIYRLAAIKQFPKPCPLGERSSAWVLNEVDDFVKRRIAARARTASKRSSIGHDLVAARRKKRATKRPSTKTLADTGSEIAARTGKSKPMLPAR